MSTARAKNAVFEMFRVRASSKLSPTSSLRRLIIAVLFTRSEFSGSTCSLAADSETLFIGERSLFSPLALPVPPTRHFPSLHSQLPVTVSVYFSLWTTCITCPSLVSFMSTHMSSVVILFQNHLSIAAFSSPPLHLCALWVAAFLPCLLLHARCLFRFIPAQRSE